MLVLLALLLAVPLQEPGPPRVEGLRDGERARIRNPAIPHDVPSEEVFVGRLLDAETGAPVFCGRIETWFEDYFDPERMPPPLERAESNRDGVFVARRADVDKVRFLLPDRAATVGVVSDFDGEEFPVFPRRPLRVRATDLSGQPIEGAWIRTRQTCAHAPTADFARSEADGLLVLDAFPPLTDLASVEIGAPGHGALDDLDPRELLWLAARDGSVDVRLPRRAPVEIEAFDLDGRPARGRVLYGEHPWRTAWLDASGRGRIDDPGSNRDGPSLALLDAARSEPRRWLPSHALPRGRAAVLREQGRDFDPAEWDGPIAEVTVDLALQVAALEAPPVWLFDARGFVAAGLGPHAFPAGEVTVVVGGAFTGWTESVVSTEAHGPVRVTVATQPEPRVQLVPPSGGLERVVVQAGDDAFTLDELDEPEAITVPPGVPIVVLAERSGGEQRRVALPEATDLGRIDLADEDTVIRRALDPEAWPLVDVFIGAVGLDGRPLESSLELVTVDWQNDEAEPTGTGAHHARVRRGTRWAARVSARGHVPRWILGAAGDEDGVRTVTLTPRANVALTGEFARAIVGQHLVGPAAAHPDAGGVQVAPGPLYVLVEREDGSWVEVMLTIEPGDDRTIDVR